MIVAEINITVPVVIELRKTDKKNKYIYLKTRLYSGIRVCVSERQGKMTESDCKVVKDGNSER